MESGEEYRMAVLLGRLVDICRKRLPPDTLDSEDLRDLEEAEEELAWRKFKEYQRKTGPQQAILAICPSAREDV